MLLPRVPEPLSTLTFEHFDLSLALGFPREALLGLDIDAVGDVLTA